MTDFDQGPAEQFLRSHGAAEQPHPGGTLYEHLRRVSALLRSWGAAPNVRAAGLCHATYGTDGFAVALLPVTDRATLVGVIGADAERLVYLYGCCVRDAVYPQLGEPGPVLFRDRFTGKTHRPSEPDVRAFVEITAANELDVLAHNAELAERYGSSLHALFGRARDRLSGAAWQACETELG